MATSATLIRSRFLDNHTRKHAYTCVYLYVYICCFVSLLLLGYLIAGCLTLCLSSMQVAFFGQQHVVGPATGHFYRAFFASVSVRVSRGCLQSTVLA